MDTLELKKILATLSIAGFLTAGFPITAGCASNTEEDKQGAQTEETTGEEAPAKETPAPSSPSSEKSGTASTQTEETPAPSS